MTRNSFNFNHQKIVFSIFAFALIWKSYMQGLSILLFISAPPLVAYGLVRLRKDSLFAYWTVILALLLPIIIYLIWALPKMYIDRFHPIAYIAGSFLILLSVSMALSVLCFVSRKWLKMLLAPVIYLGSYFIAILVGTSLGIF